MTLLLGWVLPKGSLFFFFFPNGPRGHFLQPIRGKQSYGYLKGGGGLNKIPMIQEGASCSSISTAAHISILNFLSHLAVSYNQPYIAPSSFRCILISDRGFKQLRRYIESKQGNAFKDFLFSVVSDNKWWAEPYLILGLWLDMKPKEQS